MNWVWAWPQITWLCLTGFSLFVAAVLDGEPRKTKHSLALSMFGAALSFGLLYFGGFFTEVRP